jgi:hypothetical protein
MRRLRSPKLSKNGWQELHKAAILELDPEQLPARVEAAEGAIAARASPGTQISRGERRSMDDALSALRMSSSTPLQFEHRTSPGVNFPSKHSPTYH